MTTVECFRERWLRLLFETGTWVPSWSDIILIWYHYIVICPLVTILNWWLSSKDMKLRVLIEEALVVFHWLTFRIILLCLFARGHRNTFFDTRDNSRINIHIYIYTYICIYIHIYIYIYIYIYIQGRHHINFTGGAM